MCCIIDALHVSVKVVQLDPRGPISDSSPSATHNCTLGFVGDTVTQMAVVCVSVCSINNKQFTFSEHLRLQAHIKGVRNVRETIWLFIPERKVTDLRHKIIILAKHKANFSGDS